MQICKQITECLIITSAGKFREIGDMDHTEGNSHPMGTIIVKPGCKLSMWKDFAYEGEGNDL